MTTEVAVQPVPTAADNNGDEAECIAAHIAVTLRKAGYACVVLDPSPALSARRLQAKKQPSRRR